MTAPERWALAARIARRKSLTAETRLMRATWKRDAEHWERMVRGFADALIATWQTP